MKTLTIELEREGVTLLDSEDFNWEWDSGEQAFRHERGYTSSLTEVLEAHGPVLVAVDGITLSMVTEA